ncbi:AfsR/SARP family transcriptional regulator [Sphaerisporangium rufum]|uniref:AfsR/SARP family transcriptional regulator n=1 Tax=Sphaerisporangium rufum TaxID=1381558 RepID=UPI00194DFCA0|nr:tetratricopeptide repeat protein [Sphaerisporangium rufum]
MGIVLDIGGRSHPLGTPQQQIVLASLLLDEGGHVPADILIGRLWGDHPPRKASDNLHSAVSHVRRRLREITGDGVQIVVKGGTYALTLGSAKVDLHQFRRLRRRALAVERSGDPELGIRLLREAERLWPGDALAGLPGAWAGRMAGWLAEERAGARRERIELELSLGRHAEILDELRGLTARHPADEPYAAQLMTALYLAGRRVDALDVYRRTRRHLMDELGTEPGPVLREAHMRVLNGAPDLAATAAGRTADPGSTPNTLPRDIPHFTGRQPEIAAASAPPDGTRAVVIQGMTGVGKTALAVHLAHRSTGRYPDAALYLDLRAHDPVRPPLDTAAALLELLRMLGVAPAAVPASLGARAVLWQAELAARRAVVVLDDAAGPEQVAPLLGRASSSLVMVTTQARFDGTAGIRRISLGVLPPADAAALTERLAGAGADPGRVDEVVRLCGGLPLAITLCAGRPSPAGPDRECRDGDSPARPEMSAGAGRPGRIARHRAAPWDRSIQDALPEVHSAFEISYRTLPEEARAAFRRLGLSPCRDFGEDHAAALFGTTVARARELLGLLLRHHLLQQVGPDHYRFHDLVGAYAYDRAWREDTAAENRRAVTRLLDDRLRMVEAASRAVRRLDERADEGAVESPDPVAVRRALAGEWGGVLALVQWTAESEVGEWLTYPGRFMRSMAEFLDTEGYWEDARTGHGLALVAARRRRDTAGIARASLDLGFACFRTGCHQEARENTQAAMTLYRSIGDRQAVARCQDRLGVICWATSDYRSALAYHEEAQERYHAVGDAKGRAEALGHQGIVHFHLGNYRDSLDLFTRALALHRHIGDRRGEAKALNNAGDVRKRLGDRREAVRLYRESLRIFQEIDGRQNHAILSGNLGDVRRYEGRYQEALDCYRKAMVTFQQTGDRPNQAEILNSIGSTYLRMGGVDGALVHHQEAQRLAEEIADTYQLLRGMLGVAGVHCATGRYAQARDLGRRAVALARSIGDLYQEARAHRRMADAQLCLGGPEEARISWRLAHGLLSQLGLPQAEEVRVRLQDLGGTGP